MANIPVEKKSGTPWLPILLGLLVAALALFALFYFIGDDERGGPENPIVDGMEFDDDNIEDNDDLATEPLESELDPDTEDGASLADLQTGAAVTAPATIAAGTAAVDSPANLSGLRVTELLGDRTFRAGEGSDAVVVVLRDLGEAGSQPGAPDGSDGVFNVDVGDTVDVNGTVRQYDAANADFSGLSDAEVSAVQALDRVVVVNSESDLTVN